METNLISKECLTNDKLSDLNIITAKNNGQLKALAVLSLRIEGEACSSKRSKYRRNKLNFMLNFFRLCRNLCLRQKNGRNPVWFEGIYNFGILFRLKRSLQFSLLWHQVTKKIRPIKKVCLAQSWMRSVAYFWLILCWELYYACLSLRQQSSRLLSFSINSFPNAMSRN